MYSWYGEGKKIAELEREHRRALATMIAPLKPYEKRFLRSCGNAKPMRVAKPEPAPMPPTLPSEGQLDLLALIGEGF